MTDQNTTANVNEPAHERSRRTLEVVERIISSVGEHPECELKTSWPRNTPYSRAEVIKDIQSIANSSIPSGGEKYIVVGVDETTRTCTGCNHDEYDDASIRQLLASHLERFSKVVDQLIEILKGSALLKSVMPASGKDPASLSAHSNYSVPAIESLVTAYLLAGYSLRKTASIRYISTMFPRRIREQQNVCPYLFWPYYLKGAPKMQIQLLASERFDGDDHLRTILGSAVAVPALVLQADCLLEWHSFLSFKELDGRPAGDTATVDYFENNYPPGAMYHTPSFVHERLEAVFPTLRLIAEGLRKGDNNFCALDDGLAVALKRIDCNRRLAMLGRFMIYAEVEHHRRMANQGRFGFDVRWPDDLKEIREKARNENRSN